MSNLTKWIIIVTLFLGAAGYHLNEWRDFFLVFAGASILLVADYIVGEILDRLVSLDDDYEESSEIFMTEKSSTLQASFETEKANRISNLTMRYSENQIDTLWVVYDEENPETSPDGPEVFLSGIYAHQLASETEGLVCKTLRQYLVDLGTWYYFA